MQEGQQPGGREAGFTIIESTIALVVVFGVLMGLLGALRAGTKGVVTGRQRSAALAVANEVIEQARGRGYAEVGHDLDSDPTLSAASDPALASSGGILQYMGVSPPEPLAASSLDAGAAGGTSTNPLYPFSPHRWTVTRDASVYTTSVYVTLVAPPSGDPYKRLTVIVKWTPNQYATAAKSITMSTFMFNVAPPPDPHLVGEAEADSGSFTVTGSLSGMSLSEARVTLPYAYGTVDSGFVRTAKGFATTARSELTTSGGTAPTGCAVIGLEAECPPVKAATGADNDSGTSPPDDDRTGTLSGTGGTVSAGTPLSAALTGGSSSALSTGRSCWSCAGTGLDDDDLYPFHTARASGPATASVPFRAGSADGSLLSIGVGCAADCAVATADRDDLAGTARMNTLGSVSYPAISLATFANGPAGYSGMVKIAPVTVSALAYSGPAAAAPSTTGADVAVQMWNGTGYTTVTVTPGAASPATDPATTATFSVNGAVVTMTATLHWGPKVTSSTSASGAVTQAAASLTNWMWVDVHMVVTQGSNTEADLNLHLDYGTVAAKATYQPG